MKVAVTGATGLVGRALVQELVARGDEVTAVSRDPARASAALSVEAVAWDGLADGLAGCDAVVHLAGENIAQRWSSEAKRRIHESREQGTRALVEGIGAAEPRPRTLVSMSGIDYYGDRGDQPVDEEAPPGDDFLAQVCVAWEREATNAAALGLRVVRTRNGMVLDRRGGALAKMLLPFRLGVGGPVAGGRQYVPWIHRDDMVGIVVRALDDDAWSGPVNAVAPEPVTNAEFSKALGRALRRPAVLPIPGLALRALYGDMAQLVTASRRVVPRRLQELGYEYRHPHLDEALRSALA